MADDHDEPNAGGPDRSHPRRARIVLLTVATAALVVLAASTAVLAADRFADNISSVHRPGVSFVADAGITTGCGDGTRYCPGDPVTRDQMATFMHRLSGHAPGIAPSVDAATLNGHTAEDLQGADGQDAPTELLPIAFGRVNANGTVAHGTGNFSATWDSGNNWYLITIDGVSYSGTGRHLTLVTPYCSGPPAPRTDASFGSLVVAFSGNAQCQFQFVTYESPS